MRLCASVIAIAVLSPLSAFAEETPPPAAPAATPPADAPAAVATPVVAAPVAAAPAAPPSPAAPAKSWKDLVTIDGLVDAYYLYNFSGENSLTPPAGRAFDTNSNTFTLNYAKVGLGVSSDNVGLRIDMGYGSMGNIINGATVAPLAFLVQQAYATVIPVPNLTIDLGKFATTAGAEVIEANKNWLYSRSFLFNAIPFVHTGLRVGYKVNDMVSLQGSVVNGWNGQGFEIDGNSAKTFGASVALTLPSGVGVIPTVYVGKENGSTDTRILGDLVATYTMGNLGLNLNVDYISDKALGIDNFIGFAPMAHFVVNEHLTLSGRFEFINAKIGGMPAVMLDGVSTTIEEVTVGAGIPMGGRFEFRPEFRFDNSNQLLFDANTKKNQATLTGAFLAWF
jgi:hypothetical protein